MGSKFCAVVFSGCKPRPEPCSGRREAGRHRIQSRSAWLRPAEREVVVVGHVGQDAFAVGSAVGLHVHGEGHRTSDVPDCRADDLAAACGGQLRTYLQLGRGERVERRVVAAAGRMPVEVVREQAPVAVGELQPDEMHGREFRRFRVAAVDFHFIERVAPLRGTPESEHSDVAGLLQRQRDRLFAALRVLRFIDVAPRAAVVRELQFVGCGVGVLPAEHDFGEGAALAPGRPRSTGRRCTRSPSGSNRCRR